MGTFYEILQKNTPARNFTFKCSRMGLPDFIKLQYPDHRMRCFLAMLREFKKVSRPCCEHMDDKNLMIE